MLAEELVGCSSYESFGPEEYVNHGNSFERRLRSFYKKSVIDVTGGRVCVNLAEFNRVILEYSQKRLVDVAFEFSYGHEHDEDKNEDKDFTSRAEEYLSQYGDVIPIL